MKAVKLMIFGKVQGVAFRYHARELAQSHQVSGWIRNRQDGMVEAFFQGEPSAVEAMVMWCHQGPPEARVASVTVSDTQPDPSLQGFQVKPSL